MLDIYATCLWQSKKKVDLSSLSQQLKDYDIKAPETWFAVFNLRCVIGNHYSLNQEHEQAVKSFAKAVELDPQFTYAHTLLGHEYLSMDDIHQASLSFRTALRNNSRHYNAMYHLSNFRYGLGIVAFKQEKLPLAEFYFRQALAISPQNPVLLNYIGLVVQKDQDRLHEALEIYQSASQISPTYKPFLHSQAQIHYQLKQYSESAAVLEGLNDKECMILLGKVYHKLKRKNEAVIVLTQAQDISCKSGRIRDLLEKIVNEESDEE